MNYLKNLLDKSTSASNIVRPRLKTRFESPEPSIENEVFESTSKSFSSLTTSEPKKDLSKNKGPISGKAGPGNSREDKAERAPQRHPEFLNNNNISPVRNRENMEKAVVGENRAPALQETSSSEKKEEIPMKKFQGKLEDQSFGILNPQKAIPEKESSQNLTNSTQIHSPTETVSPSIKITIGRVEVQAAKLPQQKAAKPKPVLKLSLEDYIEKRK